MSPSQTFAENTASTELLDAYTVGAAGVMWTHLVGLFERCFCIVPLLVGTAGRETLSFSTITDVFNADIERGPLGCGRRHLCDATLLLLSADTWISQGVDYS